MCVCAWCMHSLEGNLYAARDVTGGRVDAGVSRTIV